MLSKAVLFCVCIAVASAAVSLLPPQPKPEKFQNLEGCYVPELDVVIPFNSSVYSADCKQYNCEASYVSIYSCAPVAFDYNNNPSCYEFVDKEKSYPDCCLQVKCAAENSDE
ncbi:hypothetical protein O3G_MSEX014600 [Manduca sexta]|uniref:Single domain-containing protein n=1 Tax=Manduca sexta TaxID=7130 RepID=A0A921ZVU4_MANSE|nr:hypothetical protein O3G_MSEX014600 [Manduca sexta]